MITPAERDAILATMAAQRDDMRAMVAEPFNARRSMRTRVERAELAAMWAGVATWSAVGAVGIVKLAAHMTIGA